ncbi:MAG: NUDIX domain-containing protein [Treponema sp.]|jgi:ADP-ribose pyrophosphatase YjhB (NUDIX family)|nr:NUDIX domain-containing protein [Treponema sp.]
MWKYCPSCASTEIGFDGSHRYSCPACGFVFYQNTAAATGCIIRGKGGILLLVRGKEPAKGKLDLPGGFVDPGEGALEGLRRELREEIGWEPAGKTEGSFTLLASFPNTYPYRGTVYHTCDLFFTLDAPDLTGDDLRGQEEEIGGFRFVGPQNIRPEDLAFDSTRRALRAYLAAYYPALPN